MLEKIVPEARMGLLNHWLIRWPLIGGGGLVAFLVGTNLWVVTGVNSARRKSLDSLPNRDVAIVLGTAPRLAGGWANPFFESRMDAAARIYREHKVRHILVSGDNRRKDYDEPTAMLEALVKRGVPADAISRDYAGLRTLDTMERAKVVFGVNEATIVTDDFHLARSLFLARAKGLEAVGFHGEPVPWKWSKKTRCREVISRTKAWLDVYVLRTKPRHYGPREYLRI
jgi:SanA protein